LETVEDSSNQAGDAQEDTVADKVDIDTDDLLIVTEQLSKMQEAIDTYIIENDLTKALGTQLTDEGLLITLSTDFSFTSGSAYVNDTGREIAQEVAKFLYTNPPHEII